MVKLNGMTASFSNVEVSDIKNGAIDVKITGLRPGEKV